MTNAAFENGYEQRDVDYSRIHSESVEVYTRFIEAMQLKTGTRLLDVGGGYGAVLTNILDRHPTLALHYHLMDSSQKQLDKAKVSIRAYLEDKNTDTVVDYVLQDAVDLNLPPDTYDVIVCKMFIHEIPAASQPKVMKNLMSLLKPGGCILLWTADLDENDRLFYRETIRKKDELAGFNSFVENRHFLLNTELISLMEQSGFTAIEKLFSFPYELHTSTRLLSEFKNDTALLNAWHAHILQVAGQLPASVKEGLLGEVKENNIHVRFKRAIFKAIKA